MISIVFCLPGSSLYHGRLTDERLGLYLKMHAPTGGNQDLDQQVVIDEVVTIGCRCSTAVDAYLI